MILSDDPEVKKDLTVNFIVKDTENHTNFLIDYFSTWMKLNSTVVWFLKLKQLLKQLTPKRRAIHTAVSIIENDPEKQKTKLEKGMLNFKTTINRQGLCPDDYAKAEQAIICFKGSKRKLPYWKLALMSRKPVNCTNLIQYGRTEY